MKRAIFIIPANTAFSSLPSEVQQTLSTYGFQYVVPMPGTVEVEGYIIADGISHSDDLDPENFNSLGWTLLGYQQWDGKSEAITLKPLDLTEFMKYVPDVMEYGEDGEPTGSHPAPHQITHSWDGVPDIDIEEE